jgi:hypothetical protein
MLKDPALFWEIFAFFFTYLGTVTWMGAMLIFGSKDHSRRIGSLDKAYDELARRQSVLEVHLAKYDGADEVKNVVREFLERIERKGAERNAE